MTRKFQVMVLGYDPTGGFDGDEPRVGFWSMRSVTGQSGVDAAQTAVRMVEDEARTNDVIRTEWGGTPVVVAHEVEEVDMFEGDDASSSGFTFFVETDEPGSVGWFVRDK